ncbi:MAG: RluA family pseudouridine synthase [Mariprofundaceae bacterium]|nr:RluA family pseudouridine synthase [Mariprofundaceae bacterium]
MQDYRFHFQSKEPTRLDIALADLSRDIPLSRRRIRRAIDEGSVYVNKKRSRKAGTTLQGGETLRIVMIDDEKLTPFNADQLVWQHRTLYLIDKRSGQYAQEALHRSKGTLPDELARHLKMTPRQAKLLRPVHRLDRDTSGLMLLSSDPKQLQHLQSLWHSHVHKSYLAVVSPPPTWDKQRITLPIDKKKDRLGRFHASATGRACDTEVEVLERHENSALLRLIPHTGRTHQLRVHLSHIGCPILGDRRYQGKSHARLMLHAHTLHIEKPALAQSMQWTAKIDARFSNLFPSLIKQPKKINDTSSQRD